MKKDIELAIIGAGIAGVSACVYAKRSGLSFEVFEPKAIGGQLLLMENIDNYIGLGLGKKGIDLANDLAKTLSDLEISVINAQITKVTASNESIELCTNDYKVMAKAVIAATGASFRKLGIKGEDEFLGKGVSYCAVCDGFFFKGKDVIVVGGGNTAVEEALYLCEIANKVILVHRRGNLRALDYLQKKLFCKKNIEILYDSVIKEIKGKDSLEEVIIENTKSQKVKAQKIHGVFVAVGIRPNTEIFKNMVSVDNDGFILTDGQMQTSHSLIWAAGDCRKRPLKQLITAASDGAIAVMAVYKGLRGHYISV